MQSMEVKNVIISEQPETSDNYETFIKIVKAKKINVILVNRGNRVNIEKNLYFDILWPSSNSFIGNKSLNNNSIVCKLYYHDFSVLFTGDIEEEAERKILDLNQSNLAILNSTVLKVAHHGSKTSSTENFLKCVNPKIALIGVGKKNKFGHPNEEILNRLNDFKINIYRTDEHGEICIIVTDKGKLRITSLTDKF